SLFACRESHFSAYLTLWFPLLIWWTPLCLIRQILTRRFRLYAYIQLEFYRILKTQNKSQLSSWFTRVHESGSAEFRRVAAGMEADAAAICEAISSRWSNGVVEGHVNRLKMLKRQMYGRAGFELLRQRVMSPLA
ncbi:transposase, partial [Escherichia coli]